MGQVWEGTSPRWAGAPPTRGPRRREVGKGANPRADGPQGPPQVRLPLSPLWPPPRWDLGAAATPREGTLEGAQPPPSPLYILEDFGAANT